jgi:hypothetical protein
MKRLARGLFRPWWLPPLVAAVCLASGCATSDADSRPPRPGSGLREYQRLVRELQEAVVTVEKSAEGLSASKQASAPSARTRFDKSTKHLEAFSFKTRARVDAMEKRGEQYFQEWAEEISASPNEASRRAAMARFDSLHHHFEDILRDSREARQRFREFLDGLRQAQAELGRVGAPATSEALKGMLVEVASEGRDAHAALEQLMNTLKVAEVAVVAVAPPWTKSGGK